MDYTLTSLAFLLSWHVLCVADADWAILTVRASEPEASRLRIRGRNALYVLAASPWARDFVTRDGTHLSTAPPNNRNVKCRCHPLE